jgi:aminocarboxymuconate-semialdehyde decarboxylase
VHDTKGAFANTAELAPVDCAAIRGENAMRVFGL